MNYMIRSLNIRKRLSGNRKESGKTGGVSMRNFELIQSLIGETVSEEDMKHVDCYVHNRLGLFIPSTGDCQYTLRSNHRHPSYLFVIVFSHGFDKIKPSIEIQANQYLGYVLSPNVAHQDQNDHFSHYYAILIDKEYFEEQYRMYSEEKPHFLQKQFPICHDILKALNTFAFEYSKNMQNADITLEAHTTIITHWLIRSLLGKSYDMRAISSNYSVARAEHYMEQHYSENITVKQLAELGNMSVSSFNRIFRKETKRTPIEYLI